MEYSIYSLGFKIYYFKLILTDVVEMAKVLGMTSVYLEDLISPLDFEMVSDKYNSVEIEKILAVSIILSLT